MGAWLGDSALSEWDARPPEDNFSMNWESSEDAEWGDSRFVEHLEAVWEHIDHEELIRFTQDLIRIPSVFSPNDPEGNEARAAHYVADYLDGAGFEVRMEEVAPGRPNVWTVWRGDRPGKTLLFEGHTDVVTE